MNTKTQMTTASVLVAAATGFAAAGSLDLDRAFASELKSDAGTRSVLNESNMSNIEIAVGVRFGFAYNSLDGSSPSDDDTTMGFQFSDVEVAIEGDVTENMHARMSFQFGPDNSHSLGAVGGTLEDAFVDWAVNEDFTLRVGQFIPAFSSESSTSEFNMMNANRSVTHEYIGSPSWTQGVEAHFGGDTWGLAIGINDGPSTKNTEFNRGAEFDFALNARFDFYSDSDKARFDDQTSWRGSQAGWRVGAGLIVATIGGTNPAAADETDWLAYTIDAAYEGDGWALRAAFYGNDIETSATASHSNMGFELGGSFFFSDQWEGFARWDTLILDDDTASQTTGEDTFNFIAVGANYYFVPESHAAKFTIELGVSLDETADIVSVTGDMGTGAFGANSSTGFFQENAGEDGQVMISGTMQWLF